MAASELAPPAHRGREQKPGRYFFVGMAALAVVIVALAFVPEFIKFAQGTFPIAPILHVHAAIMSAWVGAFAVQAYLELDSEIQYLRDSGSEVVLLEADAASMEAIGANTMDQSKAPVALVAGLRQGQAEASRFAPFWNRR